MTRSNRIEQLDTVDGVLIAPSLLASDFARLGEEIRAARDAGADLFHVDVMDGHFVPNLTIGVPVVASLRKVTDLVLDVHLMIEHPADYVGPFIEAGADIVTFHVEVVPEPGDLLARIRELGALAGLTLNPGTPYAAIADYVSLADLVLVMSVEPGFGGQEFIPEVVDKIRAAREAMGGRRMLLEVDGGIGPGTAGMVAEAGANVLVAGSAIFGADDYARAIHDIRAAAKSVGQSARADA